MLQTVRSSTQTITFAQPADKVFGAAPFAVAPKASSGLTVSLASSTTTVCTVSGFIVTIVATGACTLTATQAGSADWQAATPVTRTFTVRYGITNLAPPSKSTFEAGSTIPVKFQLTGANGRPIADSVAAALGCTVTVAFATTTPVCATYNRTSHLFQAHLSTPSNLPRGTSYPIVVTVKVGTVTVATVTVTVTVTAK